MIISRTPLRVSFVGGGTDLPKFCNKERGAVVSTAIQKYVYIVVHPSFDMDNLIAYSKIAKTSKVEDIQNPLIREAMKMAGVTKGIGIHSIADVPAGTGLGSSSSFAVGLLNALYAYQGKHVSAKRLAEEASKIEIDILKEPIGRQDHYAAAFGGLNKIEFIGDEVKIRHLIFSKEKRKELEKNLLMFHLGGQRQSSSVLFEQGKNLDENPQIFDMHLAMRDLADAMESEILSDDISKFGEILHRNWLLKKSLANSISNSVVDKFYGLALDAGALGGKLLGAGGAGFLLIYAVPEVQNKVRRALEELREVKLSFEQEGSKIIYNNE